MSLPDHLPEIAADRHVLIAGPTASGKSALALAIARAAGGVIVNADASQVFGCWLVVTARPSEDEERAVPHRLFGHVDWRAPYSAGHWLREVAPLLNGQNRLIITGGTGLYYRALTEGMAEVPPTPPQVRAEADALSLDALLGDLDPETAAGLDTRNRMRVQRAWEVQRATGRPLAEWQAETPPPLLPISATVPILVDGPKEWLAGRIARRFDAMVAGGALDEVAAMLPRYDAALPAFRAIGVPELAAHLRGETTLAEARERAIIATRQFAKRQRTWFRARMGAWHRISPPDIVADRGGDA
jgi:tRNA dimethylallyltransferase